MEFQSWPESERPEQEEVIVGRPPIEDPPVLKRIKSKAREYGFTEVTTYRGMLPVSMGVPWEKVSGQYHSIKERLEIGTDLISKLEEIGPKFYNGFIEIVVPHEGGHTFVPENKQNEKVPYSADEIMNRQESLGIDVNEKKAIDQRESQANVYAVVEDNRHKTLDEVKKDIAGNFWYTSWYSMTHTSGLLGKYTLSIGFLRKHALSSRANSRAKNRFPWLKKEARNEIVRMALDIDREYCARLDEAKK